MKTKRAYKITYRISNCPGAFFFTQYAANIKEAVKTFKKNSPDNAILSVKRIKLSGAFAY